MSTKPFPTVAVHLPADLVARLEAVKKDREEDRDKSIEELVREMVQGSVQVREMAREELAAKDEVEQSYRERPDPWDDAQEWNEIYH
jgi:hypothetical protein